MRSLDTDTVDVKFTTVRSLIRSVQHNLRSGLNKVALQNLRHKWEGAAGTKIALDDLHLAVLCEELNVERTADVEFLGNLA